MIDLTVERKARKNPVRIGVEERSGGIEVYATDDDGVYAIIMWLKSDGTAVLPACEKELTELGFSTNERGEIQHH